MDSLVSCGRKADSYEQKRERVCIMILTWSEIYSVEEKYSRCVYNQKDRLPSKGIKDVKRGRL